MIEVDVNFKVLSDKGRGEEERREAAGVLAQVVVVISISITIIITIIIITIIITIIIIIEMGVILNLNNLLISMRKVFNDDHRLCHPG